MHRVRSSALCASSFHSLCYVQVPDGVHTLPDDFGRLSQELETAVFRVVQECLTNVHRHSGSAVAKIRIARSNGHVRVEVQDRGKGIPPEKRAAMDSVGMPGVGIRGMRERLRQLGGNLEINSNGEGTIVVAQLPVTSVIHQ